MTIATRITRTKHPYIVKRRSARGAIAEIRGKGLDVWAIVGYHRLGNNAERIQEIFPHLSLAQIYDALSYYYDHPDEIETILDRQHLDRAKALAIQTRANAILGQRKSLNKSQVKERAAELRRILNA